MRISGVSFCDRTNNNQPQFSARLEKDLISDMKYFVEAELKAANSLDKITMIKNTFRNLENFKKNIRQSSSDKIFITDCKWDSAFGIYHEKNPEYIINFANYNIEMPWTTRIKKLTNVSAETILYYEKLLKEIAQAKDSAKKFINNII